MTLITFGAKQRMRPEVLDNFQMRWKVGNLEASVRSSRRTIEGFRDPGTSLKPD
jgi:hypothetical protein